MKLGLPFICARTIAALLLLSGCAASDGWKFPFSNTGAEAPAAPPEADPCATPKDCALHLKKLVSDPKRDWIGQPQSPDAYANGTRLFAYRALRKKLTCNELQRAVEDTKAAISSLQEARYERVRTLVVDVSRELNAERAKRCRGQS
jgi:hypothetical protein